jgi:cell shape-determining protein MreD
MNNKPNPPEKRDSFTEKVRGWRLGLNLDGESLAKGGVCALLLVVFALLQTTLFTRFRPFGAVPDLILPLVAAIGMTEKEKWGAVFGVIAAFVIESLGGSTVTLLPLLYMPVGYFCGILTTYYFRDAFIVRGLYTLVTSAARGIFTLIALAMTLGDFNLITCLTDAVIPEFLATVLFAILPHLAAKAALRPFHLTREERTGM